MDVSISWRFYPLHCFGCNKLASWIRMELPSNVIVYCSEQCLKTSVTSNSGGIANVSVNPASQSIVGLGESNPIMGQLEWPFVVTPSSTEGPATSVVKTLVSAPPISVPVTTTSSSPGNTEIEIPSVPPKKCLPGPASQSIVELGESSSIMGQLEWPFVVTTSSTEGPATSVVKTLVSAPPTSVPVTSSSPGNTEIEIPSVPPKKCLPAGQVIGRRARGRMLVDDGIYTYSAPAKMIPLVDIGNSMAPAPTNVRADHGIPKYTIPAKRQPGPSNNVHCPTPAISLRQKDQEGPKYTASAIDFDDWGNDDNVRAPAPKIVDDIAKGYAEISPVAVNAVSLGQKEQERPKYTASAIDDIDFDDWGNNAYVRAPAPKIADDIAKGDAEMSPVAVNKLNKMKTFGFMHKGEVRVTHMYKASRFHIIGTREEVQQERTLLDRLIRKGLKNNRFQPFNDLEKMIVAYRDKEVLIGMKGDKCGRAIITACDPEDKLCQIEFIDNGDKVVLSLDEKGLFIPTDDVMDEPLYGLAVNLFEVPDDTKIPEPLEKLLPTLIVTVEFFEEKPTYNGNVYLEVPGDEEPYSLNMALALHQR